jgi:hypothetical protein
VTESIPLGIALRECARPVEAREVELVVPAVVGHQDLLTHLGRAAAEHLEEDLFPIRLAVTSLDDSGYSCELGVVSGLTRDRRAQTPPIFEFRRRRVEDVSSFTTVFLVPTGIGSSIGGHAGDATPAAQLLAAVSARSSRTRTLSTRRM